eukprot:7391600-Prymnesium_polylepis.1
MAAGIPNMAAGIPNMASGRTHLQLGLEPRRAAPPASRVARSDPARLGEVTRLQAIAWQSRGNHVAITWRSRGDHVTITWRSHDNHVAITW